MLEPPKLRSEEEDEGEMLLEVGKANFCAKTGANVFCNYVQNHAMHPKYSTTMRSQSLPPLGSIAGLPGV